MYSLYTLDDTKWIGINYMMHFPDDSVAKYPPDNAGDVSWIPGLERSLGEESGNPLQCSCLGNPMDRGAWQGPIHEVTKSWT